MNSVRIRITRLVALSTALVAPAVTGAAARADGLPVAAPARSDAVRFQDEILPILAANCTACHNPKIHEGGLILDSHKAIVAGGDSGPSVVAGKAAERLGDARRRGDELAYAALLRRAAGLLDVDELLDMARAVDSDGGVLQLAQAALGEALLLAGDEDGARLHLSRAVELADEHRIEDGWTMLARRRLAELDGEGR